MRGNGGFDLRLDVDGEREPLIRLSGFEASYTCLPRRSTAREARKNVIKSNQIREGSGGMMGRGKRQCFSFGRLRRVCRGNSQPFLLYLLRFPRRKSSGACLPSYDPANVLEIEISRYVLT